MRTDADPALVVEAVGRFLHGFDGPTSRRIAVAYSGGADSTALTHAVAALRGQGLVDPIALHIHHGLAPAADAWLMHCEAQAATFGLAFDAARIALARHGESIEAEARRLRYAALVSLCRRHGCDVLLTAHHADDQAETILVNLARGAGIAGLAATARTRRLDDHVLLHRPLIDVPGAAVRAYVALHRLPHVVDPSNQDRRYTRNAIRHDVMPALRKIAPGIATRLGQTASHAATMQQLLDEIGREDLAADGPSAANDLQLDVDRLRSLSAARASNALRVWLAGHGMRAPSTAALQEMLDQLQNASPSAQIALLHERQTLRLYRGRVSIDRGGPPRPAFTPLTWRGESRIGIPGWNGTLRFVTGGERGFDPLALRAGPLALRERRGGERLRVRADGPSRTLKNLYQEAGIAAWQRARLPLVYLGDRLLYAAGVGANAAAMVQASAGVATVGLEWEPDPVVTKGP